MTIYKVGGAISPAPFSFARPRKLGRSSAKKNDFGDRPSELRSGGADGDDADLAVLPWIDPYYASQKPFRWRRILGPDDAKSADLEVRIFCPPLGPMDERVEVFLGLPVPEMVAHLLDKPPASQLISWSVSQRERSRTALSAELTKKCPGVSAARSSGSSERTCSGREFKQTST
ncbi:atp-dependent dna ligase [Lasius niger]|uniref:Atp-dependent dna ligase n=1 Tax=Lasius niger TaxID=67767 RepID=A0A0J7KA99_LASNI|nr:atp-dependent dna ligase [Lasius niger]